MPGALTSHFTSEMASAVLAVLVIAVGIFAYRKWRAARISPEERERLRRASLAAGGKMGDATLVEMRGEMLCYSYAVRGVEYTACQDLSRLRELIPAEFSALGPVSVKYDPHNPANSIVLAEAWSGLRTYKAG